MNDPTGNTQHEKIRGQSRLIFWFAMIKVIIEKSQRGRFYGTGIEIWAGFGRNGDNPAVIDSKSFDL